MKRAGEFLLGGALVYVAMAANAAGCASAPEPYEGALGVDGQGGAPMAQAGASGAGDGGYGGAPVGPSGGAGAVAHAGSSGSPGSGGAGGIFDPVPDADAKSGTRLKALVQRGSDGSEQPTFTWQDTERGNEVCTFRVAADGKTRCMPSPAVSSGYFADAGCQTPVMVVPTSAPSCGSPGPFSDNYLASTVTSGCAGARLYQRGGQLSVAFIGTPASCNQATIPPGYVIYALGAEVPPTSFVEASVVALPLRY